MANKRTDHDSVEGTLCIQGPDSQLHIASLNPLKPHGHILDAIGTHKQILQRTILQHKASNCLQSPAS